MTARWHLLVGAWIAPFGVLGTVGLHMREVPDHYQAVEYGETDAVRLFAYASPVRMVERLNITPSGRVEPERLREVADAWIRQHENGRLQDVPQAAADDDSSVGPRYDILNARARLVQSLTRLGAKEAAAGRRSDALADFVRAVRVARVFRYSDLISASKSTIDEYYALRQMRSLGLSPDPDAQRHLTAVPAGAHRRQLAWLLNHHAALIAQDEARGGHPQEVDLTEVRHIAGIIGHGRSSPDVDRQVRRLASATSSQMPGYVLMARTSWTMADRIESERAAWNDGPDGTWFAGR